MTKTALELKSDAIAAKRQYLRGEIVIDEMYRVFDLYIESVKRYCQEHKRPAPPLSRARLSRIL